MNIIEYIVETTTFRQKDLAEKLGVSRGQISKWKSGEYIPIEREEALVQLVGLFTHNVAWAALVKTKENADAWCQYLAHENEGAEISSSTLGDDPDIHAPIILLALASAGVPIPASPPPEDPSAMEYYPNKGIADLITDVIDNYGRYINWCEVHLLSVEDDDASIIASELHDFAVPLAIGSAEDRLLLEAGAEPRQVRHYVQKERVQARAMISDYCNALVKAQLPLKYDYFAVLKEKPYELEDMSLANSGSDTVEDERATYGDKMNDYLSFGERRVLVETMEVKSLLKSLHKKIDELQAQLKRGDHASLPAKEKSTSAGPAEGAQEI